MHSPPFYLILPLIAAVVFAMGNLSFKRAFAEGVDFGRVFVINNVLMGLAFLPMLAYGTQPLDWHKLLLPALAGALFFAGLLFNFFALRVGDVSVATPLMGSKVVFVALISAAVFHTPLKLEHWIASILTAVGVFVLGASEIRPGGKVGLTTLFALTSSLLFATCDGLVQQWAKDFGVAHFLAAMFATLALLSLAIAPFCWPRKPKPLPVSTWRWVITASVFTAVQAMCMTIAIGVWHDATGVNVVYSTRGLWSLMLVWFVGHWFANSERHDVGKRMIWRAVGAVLMMIAVALSVIGSSR